MKPGDKVAGGVIVRVTDRGVYLGREADGDEECPADHSEHTFGETRVFLSDGQGPVDPKSDLLKSSRKAAAK